MAFKGEIALGALNSKFQYGFTIGDIYRVQGAGNLVPNNYAVTNGEFVEWTADGWQHSNENYATLTNVSGATGAVLDDNDPEELEIDSTTKEFYDEHELGRYYAIGDKVWLCTVHTRSGELGSYTYNTVLLKQNGVVPVINDLVTKLESQNMVDLGAKTEADLTDGVYVISAPNSHTGLTLTTVAALTVRGNPGLGNFEILIDNSGNANDVTVTVKSNNGLTTYLHSSAGTDVTAGKIAQLTCVGTCWTLAEFEAPTP